MKPLQLISDMATLAKAGYKMEDINKILNEDTTEGSSAVVDTKPEETVPKEDTQPEVSDKPDEESVDYKSLYESLKQELDTVKADLKTAQDFNKSKPVYTESVTGQDAVNNLFRDLIS